MEVGHQCLCCGHLCCHIVHTELDEQHHLARGRGAQHNAAQQALAAAHVVEREAVLLGIAAYLVADAVVDVVHQVALLNIENLVESTGDVKAHGVHVLKHHARLHFFKREPTLVGETKLQLVAIRPRMLAAEDGRDFGQFHLANAAQLLLHLLLLVVYLTLVGQALPFATTAHAKVPAEGRSALGAGLNDAHNLGLGKLVFLAAHLQINHIARHGIGYEHCQAVHVGNGLALGGYIFDSDIFQKR